MSTGLKILLSIIGVLAVLLLVAWAGFRVLPKPFEPYSQSSPAIETVPIPDGLPAPVDRFYHTIYGDEMPVIETAVISGRAWMKPFGPMYLPGRFRFTHLAGQSYRHYFEMTWFGIPVFTVNERYLDGVSRFHLPFFPITENGPKSNQGGNLGMWSESIWMPSIFLTDPRVHWEPVDDVTALLIVPFEDGQETYVARFNPETGLLKWLESMRYHSDESTEKTLWMNDSVEWGEVNGYTLSTVGAAIWMDDGKPWATFTVEDIQYNVDVQEYLRIEGN